ncbi:uncharacterized protein METZ01_LOCUS450286, partial [marine metagenome]
MNMNRRDFVSTTATGLTCAGLAPLGLEAKKGSFRGKILKSVKFGGRPNIDRLKKLKDLGFDGVEGSGPGMQIDGLKKALAEVGLPMHGVVYNKHWKVRLSSPKPETREASRKGLEDAMRESKAVGGTSVLLVPGKVGGKDETHEHVWSRSIEQIRKCIPLCKKLKIHILIETVWNGFCLKPEQFRDYIDEIDSP